MNTNRQPRIVRPGFYERVYTVVRRVPAGSVTTYADVGAQLGASAVARHVGYALAALPDERVDVPWHRVVNGRGTLSARCGTEEQRRRLLAEGIELNDEGRIVDFAARRFAYDD